MQTERETTGSTSGSPILRLPHFGERQNLRQEVAAALRAALITGELKPGEVYSVPALADNFGVSATPVREALLDLANDGQVEPVRNKGFRVRELSDRDLDEITSLRALIEVPTVARLAEVVDDQMRRALSDLLPLTEEMKGMAHAADLVSYVEADRKFHLMLLAMAGNRHLVDVVANLRDRSRLYGLQALADRGQLDRSALEHVEILERVIAGDADGAARVMRSHIGHVRGSWAGREET